MNLRLKLAASAFAIVTLASAGAQAATLYNGVGVSTAEMDTNSAYSIQFTAPSAGSGNLSFVLDGYASLDGQNWYEDDFTLTLNGVDIFKGTFNLGGGGNDVVFSNPNGAAYENTSNNGVDVTWDGGHVNFSTPIALASGNNVLTFAYTSMSDDHAGWQGMGDEGWGVSDINVTAGAVPEPASWALMIMGFGSLGVALRRSRRQLVLARI